jgi:hypothetical protein
VLISGNDPHRLRQHRAVIDAAKAAGVGHFYYTSGVRADDPTFALGADHKATQDAIEPVKPLDVWSKQMRQYLRSGEPAGSGK